MNSNEVIRLLSQVPDAIEITLKSRKQREGKGPCLSCSIPIDRPVPTGWSLVNEAKFQRISGYVRVKANG